MLKIKSIELEEEEFLGVKFPTFPKQPSEFFTWMMADEGLNQERMQSLFTALEAVLQEEEILQAQTKKERLLLFTRMSKLVYSELKNE